MTSVANESEFSEAGKFLSDNRGPIFDDSMHANMRLRSWKKHVDKDASLATSSFRAKKSGVNLGR